MADISQKELREEITAILKDADLNTTSAKKVRQQIEKKLDIDLSDRKKEVDDLVMECLQEKQDEAKDDDDEEEEEEEEEEESEEEKKPAKKRGAPAKKPAKRKAGSDSESEDEDEASDEEYSPKKKASPKKGAAAAAKGAKKSKGSDDSDDDWKQPKKKAAPKKAATGKKGGGGFTKVYNLTPELAAVVGQDTMARHEVVKKVWAIIKERNLYDPKNKQYAICDDQMMKVFKVKRFRTFGMMKYLKDHFVD